MRLTASVTGKWAGVDKVWEQKKLEARKRLEKRADSHLSGARIVRRTHGTPTFLIDNKYQTHLATILPTMITLAITKKDFDQPKLEQSRVTDKAKKKANKGTELSQEI